MKPGRARYILLRRLAWLEAHVALGGRDLTHDIEEARALRFVLNLDQVDEQRVNERRAQVTPKVVERQVKRASAEELLRAAAGALRDIQSVDVAGVLARIEKERAS